MISTEATSDRSVVMSTETTYVNNPKEIVTRKYATLEKTVETTTRWGVNLFLDRF